MNARRREWGRRTVGRGGARPGPLVRSMLPATADDVQAVRPPRPRVLAPTPGVEVRRELLGELRALPRLLVLEEDERVSPACSQGSHTTSPGLEVRRLVPLVAQAEVADVPCRLERGMAVLGIGDAQRGVGGAQRGIRVLGEPRRRPEFPCAAQVRGEQRQEVLEPGYVL